eukprot:COSAG01_NODE_76758_length_178_cov_19.151899_1_plen_55_part_01
MVAEAPTRPTKYPKFEGWQEGKPPPLAPPHERRHGRRAALILPTPPGYESVLNDR